MDLRFRSTSFNLISSCYCIEVISWHTRKETLTYVHFFCTQSKFSENKVGPDLNQVISARWIKKGEGILLINQYSFFLYYVIRCILWNSVFCLTSRIISFFQTMTSMFLAQTTCQMCFQFLEKNLIKSCWIVLLLFVKLISI